MYKRVFTTIAVLLAAGAVLAQAYRWVDEDGVVHFSDRPEPGAERIQLPESPAPRPAPTPRSTTSSSAAAATVSEPEEEPFGYDTLEITTPGAEQTLWNIEGVLTVSLNLQPSLQPGHQVRVFFDGEERMMSRSTSFQVDEVYRGVHNIQVEVVNETGALMIRSQPNRFYVQQNSIAMAH
jgi:hypothetical protein